MSINYIDNIIDAYREASEERYEGSFEDEYSDISQMLSYSNMITSANFSD